MKRVRKSLYLGFNVGKSELFRAAETPTHETHGNIFAAVVGPFRTKAGAVFMRDHGQNNPHCRCVSEAEKLAKVYSHQYKDGKFDFSSSN